MLFRSSDVAPARKQDPGELFPWPRLAAHGIGLWPANLGQVAGAFEANLRAFGYGIYPDTDVSLEMAVSAFQRHFRPAAITGIADLECERILSALLQKKK